MQPFKWFKTKDCRYAGHKCTDEVSLTATFIGETRQPPEAGWLGTLGPPELTNQPTHLNLPPTSLEELLLLTAGAKYPQSLLTLAIARLGTIFAYSTTSSCHHCRFVT